MTTEDRARQVQESARAAAVRARRERAIADKEQLLVETGGAAGAILNA